MKETDLKLLDDMYNSQEGLDICDTIVHSLQRYTTDKKTLISGYVHPYLDVLTNCKDIRYAVHHEYNIDTAPIPLSKKIVHFEDKKLPFEENIFDVVILSHVIEFTTYPHELLKDALRILDGGGSIIIIVANRTKKIKTRSTNEIVNIIRSNNTLSIDEIAGLSRHTKVKMWPYDFQIDISKYNNFLISMTPFVSDITVIKATKLEPELIPSFQTKYGIANG